MYNHHLPVMGTCEEDVAVEAPGEVADAHFEDIEDARHGLLHPRLPHSQSAVYTRDRHHRIALQGVHTFLPVKTGIYAG